MFFFSFSFIYFLSAPKIQLIQKRKLLSLLFFTNWDSFQFVNMLLTRKGSWGQWWRAGVLLNDDTVIVSLMSLITVYLQDCCCCWWRGWQQAPLSDQVRTGLDRTGEMGDNPIILVKLSFFRSAASQPGSRATQTKGECWLLNGVLRENCWIYSFKKYWVLPRSKVPPLYHIKKKL